MKSNRSTAVTFAVVCLSLFSVHDARSAFAAFETEIELIAEDIATLPGFSHSFGSGVGIDGGVAVVGARGTGFGLGAAYLFDAYTGAEGLKLTPSDGVAGDFFGRSVAIDGTKAIIGAPNKDVDEFRDFAGAAYLFDANTGDELFRLTPPDPQFLGMLGFSVAIDGNFAVVGELLFGEPATNGGRAHVFDVTTGEWMRDLLPESFVTTDNLGWSVGVSGSTAIVGGRDGNTALLFDVTTGEELHRLTPDDAESGTNFGWSVAIDGNTAIVGDPLPDGSPGSAYLYDVTTGQQLMQLSASDGHSDNEFGSAVAIDGNLAVVGARTADGIGASYVFDVTTGKELVKLQATNDTRGLANGPLFGDAVAISGNRIVVGADERIEGAAYLYVPEPTTGVLLLVATALALVVQRQKIN